MFEEILPLEPVHFFSLGADLHYYSGKKEATLASKYHLPDLFSLFFEETAFATVSLGWSEKGIYCTVETKIAFTNCHFPDFRAGDSVELFFDTRDAKSSSFTKFCHHFLFLPESIENNIQVLEISKFVREDSHPLADPSLLFLETEKKFKGFVMRIFLPQEALHGYDPSQFDRLGFTYRINRSTGLPQYFSASGEEVAIEGQPSLWASLNLKK